MVERLEKAKAFLGQNGAKKVEAGGNVAAFASMADADIAYASDEIDLAEYKKQRKRFNVPDIAR